MATTGGLGGLGGMGSTYPQRFGAPHSQHVQSLGEIQKPIWDEYNKALSGQADATGAFWSKADPLLDQRFVPQLAGSVSNGAFTPQQAENMVENNKRVFKSFVTHGDRDMFNATFAHLPSDQVDALYTEFSNAQNSAPNYQDFKARADALATPFLENQRRGQQAYDSMSGWNQQNGVLGPDYVNANFGQVNGQGAPQIQQMTGVNNDWMQGLFGAGSNSGLPNTPMRNGQMNAPNWSGMFGNGAGTFGSNGGGQIPKWGI